VRCEQLRVLAVDNRQSIAERWKYIAQVNTKATCATDRHVVGKRSANSRFLENWERV